MRTPSGDVVPAVLSTVALPTATGGHVVLWHVGDIAATPYLDELESFARRAAVAISSARVYEERSELARTLRASLVPAPLPSISGVQLGAAYRPAHPVRPVCRRCPVRKRSWSRSSLSFGPGRSGWRAGSWHGVKKDRRAAPHPSLPPTR